MKRRVIFVAFALLAVVVLVLPLVAAASEINIRSISGHRASVVILGAGDTYKLLDSSHIDTGDAGEFTVNYGGDEDFRVSVKIAKDGQTVILEKFGPFTNGEALYLQVIPGKVHSNYQELDAANGVVEEETAEEETADEEEDTEEEEVAEETEETAEEGEEAAGITGGVISGLGDTFSNNKTLYYIFGGVIVGLVLIFIVLRVGKGVPSMISKAGGAKSSSGGFGSKPEGPKPDVGAGKSEAQKQLEAQLTEARKEISKLKKEEENIGKIVEVERRLESDKAELEKLKSGE